MFTNGSGNVSELYSNDSSMDNLYQALFESFTVILCGYIAGRCNLISQHETKGLNTFVSFFSLPALIFVSLAELNLKSVNWMFLLAVLIAKGLVFFVVVIFTLLTSKPKNPGRAGLFAIFCTQSNDFAIGYPIVISLYQRSHPEYAAYLYLIAPISLAILNPFGFVLMEISKRQTSDRELVFKESRLQLVSSIIKNIIFNPIVLMTALGVVGNVVFSHQLPSAISGVLKVFGSAFSATALFLLGHRMVGKVHQLQGAALLIPGILIAMKLLVFPLVLREISSLLNIGVNSSDTTDLSTFGFLYGTFPSAPGVFVFATQYMIDVDLIASSMVACTFISAPLMFVSAKMVSLRNMTPANYMKELGSFCMDISIAGIIVCIWLLAVFICSKRYKRIPHRITCCLIISQLISCLGIILWSVLDRSKLFPLYVQFSVLTVGIYSSRLWTAFLAVTMLFLQCRSLCIVLQLQPFFIITGWGCPILLVTVLVLTVDVKTMVIDQQYPNFQYGETQAIFTLIILIFTFIVTLGCLVLQQRYRHKFSRYLLLIQDTTIQNNPSTCSSDEMESSNGCCSRTVIDIEELVSSSGERLQRSAHNSEGGSAGYGPGDLCPSRFGCSGPTREKCSTLVNNYRLVDETEGDDEGEQTLRHVVLLLLLLCSTFVGISLSIWTLVMEEFSSIYVELVFLDASLNIGQPLLTFAVFGLETKAFIPFVKCWRRLVYGADTLKLKDWADLDFETRHVCDQFTIHHLEKCRTQIAKNMRWRLKLYKNSFSGSQFVDWLLNQGLAKDRTEASEYGSHLVDGGLITHVEHLYHFQDGNLLFKFGRD